MHTHKCYLPQCSIASRWLVSPTDVPDEDREACETHLARAVSRVSRKHHGSAVALTPLFVIQKPIDLGALLPLVEMGATIHGLIADTSRATALAAEDRTIRTAAHLTALPSPPRVEGVQETLGDPPAECDAETSNGRDEDVVHRCGDAATHDALCSDERWHPRCAKHVPAECVAFDGRLKVRT